MIISDKMTILGRKVSRKWDGLTHIWCQKLKIEVIWGWWCQLTSWKFLETYEKNGWVGILPQISLFFSQSPGRFITSRDLRTFVELRIFRVCGYLQDSRYVIISKIPFFSASTSGFADFRSTPHFPGL